MNGRTICRRLGEERGVTLTELLVVLVILLVVLAGMTTLFVSAGTSQIDQTKRVEAQLDARLALDSLRREIRCASSATLNSPLSLTIELPGYCQKPPTLTPDFFTWCTVGASAPYTLWRYAGSSCTGTGRSAANSLASNDVFTYSRSSAAIVGPPTLTPTATSGTLGPGTYIYDVTAVDAANRESSGTNATITFAAGDTNKVTLNWTGPAWAVSYNVYGRSDSTTTVQGMRLLGSTAGTSFLDTGGAFASMATPPLGRVGISLVIDASPGDAKQRFTLRDDIVLRNSGRR